MFFLFYIFIIKYINGIYEIKNKKVNMNIDNIVTGEKLQKIADIYIGDYNSFEYNPNIQIEKHKQFDINQFKNITYYNNPKIVFCYGHFLKELSEYIDCFLNDFVLISHNSDENIIYEKHFVKIINCKKIIKWFSQNISFKHNKLEFIPIGIANSMWEHGNLNMFKYIFEYYDENKIKQAKQRHIYMNFKIETNMKKRTICYNELHKKIPFLEKIKPFYNLLQLIEYKYCICPEGNGFDTHRLWECFYLKVVPIVIKTDFIEIIRQTDLPMIVLNSWSELDVNNMPEYDSFDFTSSVKFLKINYYENKIRDLFEN